MSTQESILLVNQGAPELGYASKTQFETYIVKQTGRKQAAAQRITSNVFNTLFGEDQQFKKTIGGTKLLSTDAVATVAQVAGSSAFSLPSERYDAIKATTTRLMDDEANCAEVFGEPLSDDERDGSPLNLDTARDMLETGQISINPHSPINAEAQFVLRGFITSRES